MPIVYSNPAYPYQVSFGGLKAPSTQLNYREMIGEVTNWNPNVSADVAGRWINNYYRKVIDMRNWYGLKLRGQIQIANPIVGGANGQVSVTAGNPLVTGIGTTWTPALIGLQFRTGFQYPYQTIVNVDPGAQVITLDTPFAGATQNPAGYFITQTYLDFGNNVNRMLWAVNQQMGWPLTVNFPVETINQWDTWRQQLGWSTVLATRSASPGGGLIFECWPTPNIAQTIPFEAYQQPPDLVEDEDSVVSWIPTDLIVERAIADALVYRGPRNNQYYDRATAQDKRQEFNERVESAMNADNNMDQQDVTWSYGEEGDGGAGNGSTWAQSHGVGV